ncbi:MAG: hypothetical protein LQ337_000224 [Flavoplaca oasis]|nr:MAG: hypothetical protein LQ337_000224 [Flavoplaca oasis]
MHNVSLLKSHKALPKRRNVSSNAETIRAHTRKLQNFDREAEGYSSSERIRSWIVEPSSVHAVPDPGLPLTPPASERVDGLCRHQSPSNLTDKHHIATHTVSPGLSTPVMQRSPPTPETTPPKFEQYTGFTTDFSSLRIPSIRAESFETARENQNSDEESGLIDSPSLRPSRQKWLQDAGHPVPKNIGLGLGLEHDNGVRTPTGLPDEISPNDEDLISFDGGWNVETPEMEMEAVKGGADLAYRAELKKHQVEKSWVSDHLLDTPLVIDKSTPSPLARSVNLRQGVHQERKTPPRTSTEHFAEKIQWPRKDGLSDLEKKPGELYNKRSSQISTTSTIVEAMVINAPPQRRRTLRHSSKVADLASATTQANRNSLNLSERSQRRLLRHSKSPDGGQRASFVSATGARSDGTTLRSVQGQDTKSAITLQQTSRPATAPEDSIGYFDVPRPRRRIVSADVATSPPKEDDNPNLRKTRPSNAPYEASSSIHNSRHVSRTTSNASAQVESMSPPTRQQSQNDYSIHETSNGRMTSPDDESSGDYALRFRSSLVTPFSLRSARSSTPGTLEVNEATAISIYPHTNRSILVVQHAPRRDSQQPEHSAIIASNAKFAIPAGSVQPPVIHQPRQLLDSPLQNPRSPPQPPDFKIIPPTPANAMELPESKRQEQPLSEQETPKRRLSNRVKRALSTRRYSEAFATPLIRSMSLSSRRNTVHGGVGRRASTGIDPDRNLHPFWRPRAFWDDRSDSDSDFGNDGPLVGNSLGMPTDGIKTFDPPKRRSSLSQRLGSLRVPRRRKSDFVSNPQNIDGYHDDDLPNRPAGGGSVRRLNTAKGLGLGHKRDSKFYRSNKDGVNTSYEFIQRPQHISREQNGEATAAGEEDEEGAHHGVPRLGYQVQFVGFKGLAEKVKERRERARREKVRDKLRGSIDVLRGV